MYQVAACWRSVDSEDIGKQASGVYYLIKAGLVHGDMGGDYFGMSIGTRKSGRPTGSLRFWRSALLC